MSSLQKSILKSKLPPFPPSRYGYFYNLYVYLYHHYLSENKIFFRLTGRQAARKKDYSPVLWDKYFDKFEEIQLEQGSFRVYKLGSVGPALVLLHGGGLSALGWSIFAVSAYLFIIVSLPRFISQDLPTYIGTSFGRSYDWRFSFYKISCFRE